MKFKFPLFIFIYIYAQYSYSQCLSVELTIKWKKETNYLSIDSLVTNEFLCIPYLVVTYRNNTEQPIYFLKIIKGDSIYPNFINPIINYANIDLSDQIKKHDSYLRNSYNVNIDDPSFYLSGWEILKENIDPDSNHVADLINSELSNIYSAIKMQNELNKLNNQLQLNCFNYKDKAKISYREAKNKVEIINIKPITLKKLAYNKEDITESNILNNMSNNFVFLDKDTSYTEYFSLIGLYVLEGNYNFSLNNIKSNGYVYGNPYFDNNSKKWTYIKIPLPERVHNYFLYTGKYISNSSSIKINLHDIY